MGGRGSAGSTPSFTQSGSKISVNGDTINMTKRGAYQGTVGEKKTSMSKDGRTSTTIETSLYKSNSGALYEVTEKTTIRERSASESALVRGTNNKYRNSGAVTGTSSLGDMYKTETKITKVRRRG